MKRFYKLAAFIFCLSAPFMVNAQQNEKEKASQQKMKEKQLEAKENQRYAETLSVYGNVNGEDADIIIKRKNEDKDAKVTIEIKGEKIMVNGKPIAEFEDEDIAVILKPNPRIFLRSASPFRNSGTTVHGLRNFNEGLYNSDQGFLGVSTTTDEKGAIVVNVTEESPAAKAGLQVDDIIFRIDDTKIENPDALSKAIKKKKKGDKVIISFLRNNKEQKVTATLAENNSFNFNFEMPSISGMGDLDVFMTRGPKLGIQAQDLEEGDGAKVLGVDKDSPAEKSGLRKDDIITNFDGKEIKSVDDLVRASREVKDKSSFDIRLNRNGNSQNLTIKIPKKLKTANL